MEEESDWAKQWGSFLKDLGQAAVTSWAATQNYGNQPPPPPPSQPASSVPRWVIYAGVAASVIALVLILRRR